MDHEERIKVEKKFKDPVPIPSIWRADCLTVGVQTTGGYKKRAPSMMEFINLILDIPFLNEWEFDRQVYSTLSIESWNANMLTVWIILMLGQFHCFRKESRK